MSLGLPIYDRGEAIERLEGDAELFAEMAGLFIADAESYCAQLETALKMGDAGEVRREAHSLKSLFATFSSEGGRVLAERLEQLAAGGRLCAAPQLVPEVLAAIRALAAALAEDVPAEDVPKAGA